MAKIQIRLLNRLAVVEAGICLKGEEEKQYSISGFPRSLVQDNSQTMSKTCHGSMQLTFFN
jgi:hypothetical protein